MSSTRVPSIRVRPPGLVALPRPTRAIRCSQRPPGGAAGKQQHGQRLDGLRPWRWRGLRRFDDSAVAAACRGPARRHALQAFAEGRHALPGALVVGWASPPAPAFTGGVVHCVGLCSSTSHSRFAAAPGRNRQRLSPHRQSNTAPRCKQRSGLTEGTERPAALRSRPAAGRRAARRTLCALGRQPSRRSTSIRVSSSMARTRAPGLWLGTGRQRFRLPTPASGARQR